MFIYNIIKIKKIFFFAALEIWHPCTKPWYELCNVIPLEPALPPKLLYINHQFFSFCTVNQTIPANFLLRGLNLRMFTLKNILLLRSFGVGGVKKWKKLFVLFVLLSCTLAERKLRGQLGGVRVFVWVCVFERVAQWGDAAIWLLSAALTECRCGSVSTHFLRKLNKLLKPHTNAHRDTRFFCLHIDVLFRMCVKIYISAHLFSIHYTN